MPLHCSGHRLPIALLALGAPWISVKRKVKVPEGRSGTARSWMATVREAEGIVAPGGWSRPTRWDQGWTDDPTDTLIVPLMARARLGRYQSQNKRYVARGGTRTQEVGHERGGLDDLLEVVELKQESRVAQHRLRPCDQRLVDHLSHGQRLADGGSHQRWITDRRERNDRDTIGEVIRHRCCRTQREPRLADPTRASQCEQGTSSRRSRSRRTTRSRSWPMSGVRATGREEGWWDEAMVIAPLVTDLRAMGMIASLSCSPPTFVIGVCVPATRGRPAQPRGSSPWSEAVGRAELRRAMQGVVPHAEGLGKGKGFARIRPRRSRP